MRVVVVHRDSGVARQPQKFATIDFDGWNVGHEDGLVIVRMLDYLHVPVLIVLGRHRPEEANSYGTNGRRYHSIDKVVSDGHGRAPWNGILKFGAQYSAL